MYSIAHFMHFFLTKILFGLLVIYWENINSNEHGNGMANMGEITVPKGCCTNT